MFEEWRKFIEDHELKKSIYAEEVREKAFAHNASVSSLSKDGKEIIKEYKDGRRETIKLG